MKEEPKRRTIVKTLTEQEHETRNPETIIADILDACVADIEKVKPSGFVADAIKRKMCKIMVANSNKFRERGNLA